MQSVSSIANSRTGFSGRPISVHQLLDRTKVHSVAQAIAAYNINDFHRRTGGGFGPLGIPIGEITKLADGSYEKQFQLGVAQQKTLDAPVTGLTNYQANVILAAVKCFGTFSSFQSNTDTTYAVISLISVDPNAQGTDQQLKTIVTPIQNDVKAGSIIFQGTTLGSFPLAGLYLLINVALWRHVDGDSNAIRDKIQSALQDAINKGVAAISGAASSAADTSTSGGTVGDITNFEVGGIKPINLLTGGLADVVAGFFADKLIDQHTFQIPTANIIALTGNAFQQSIRTSPDLSFDIQLNWPPTPADEYLFSGGGGSYKAYFLIEGISIPTQLTPKIG